jgi:hypothetical protein
MAKKTKKVVPVFQLRAVELHELFLNKPVPGSPAFTNFNFTINVESNADKDKKLLIASTKVKIKGDSQTSEVGSLTCACIFSVANFEDVITIQDDGHVELYQPFADAINSIAISTTRGVMFSELKGTFLHYAFLPVVDVKGLVKVADGK